MREQSWFETGLRIKERKRERRGKKPQEKAYNPSRNKRFITRYCRRYIDKQTLQQCDVIIFLRPLDSTKRFVRLTMCVIIVRFINGRGRFLCVYETSFIFSFSLTREHWDTFSGRRQG